MNAKMVDPEKISMGSINPRIDLGDLTDLITSMRERQERKQRAVVLPLLVKKLETERYDFEIIDGKRRLQSALQLRLPEVPVVEETDTDSARELTIMSYLANESRKDFDWVERAKTFVKLHDEYGMTLSEIGSEVNLSEQRVSNYVTLLERVSRAGELGRALVMDMETVREIINKCPDEDIPELLKYAIDNDIPRDDMRKILFALRNFEASQTVVKDFHEGLYNTLQEKYHQWKFNPKFMAHYQKEKTLKTGELNLVDFYLDVSEYPTRESAQEYATSYNGEVVKEIHRDGWHLRIYPYNMSELDEKYKELVEKFS